MSETSKNKQPLRWWHPILLGFVLVVVIGVAWFLRRPSPFPKEVRRIILISIDTCRADYLSCYGYPRKITPNIDAVAQEGVLFKNVLAPIPLTLPAHASMLTGTIPPYHGIHDNLDYRLGNSNATLAEILQQNGFSTGAIVSASVLDAQFGLDQGFDAYNDRFEEALANYDISERRGAEASRFAIEWLDKHKTERFFLFLHYYDPHLEYVPPEPFASEFADNPYAGEIAYTDYCIGQVIRKLKELELYDSTLIIITGDHGELFGEHGENGHGYFIYEGAVKVPLIFKLSRQEKSKEVKHLVGLIDIVPTVCSLVGIQPPSQIQGKDVSEYFLERRPISRDRFMFCESLYPTKYNANSLLGVVTNRWKYIQTTRSELYDLTKDPQETNNLIKQQLQRARILQDRLRQILNQQIRKGISDNKLALDEESRKRLESLGYIAGASVTEDFEFDQSKDDPKDLIDFHSSYEKITPLISLKRYSEAKSLCEKLLIQRPDSFVVRLSLARIAMEQGNYAGAVPHLSDVLSLKPDDFTAHNKLGLALTQLGKVDEAIKHCRKALELRPEEPTALNNLGIALLRQGKRDEAMLYFNKALQINPKLATAHGNLAYELLKQGKIDEAIGHYESMLRIWPNRPDVPNRIASLLAKHGKLDLAITYFKKALALNPQMPDTHYHLATILRRQGKPAEAVVHYDKALLYDPYMWKAYYGIGNVYLKTGELDEAVINYNEALDLNPNFPEAHCNIGIALSQQGKFEEAIIHYEKALTLRPKWREALTNLSIAKKRKEKLEKTIASWSKSLQDNPNQPELHNKLGTIFHQQGDLDRAIHHWNTALKLRPNWPDILNNLAGIMASQENSKFSNPDEAIRLAQRSCELTGFKQPLFLNTLASAYAADGRFREAAETAQKALDLARSTGQKKLATKIRNRLELYNRGQ